MVLTCVLLAFGLSYSDETSALSCRSTVLDQTFRDSKHAFLVMITHAHFERNAEPDAGGHLGRVIVEFEHLETFQGDIAGVPHIEVKMYADDDWAVEIPVGQRRFLFTKDDGPASWDSCSKRTALYNECKHFWLKLLSGNDSNENAECERYVLREYFERRNIQQKSEHDDLEGMQQEWIERFGQLPY